MAQLMVPALESADLNSVLGPQGRRRELISLELFSGFYTHTVHPSFLCAHTTQSIACWEAVGMEGRGNKDREETFGVSGRGHPCVGVGFAGVFIGETTKCIASVLYILLCAIYKLC